MKVIICIIIFILALLTCYYFNHTSENFENSEKTLSKPKEIYMVRIIGNCLPDINDPNQNLNNLKYILENEEDFPNVTKIWILNRIVDKNMEEKYKKILKQNKKHFETIPFNKDYFNNIKLNDNSKVLKKNENDYKYFKLIGENMDKILYISNINGARNYSLERFRKKCDYLMVLDANIFLTQNKFEEIENVINNNKNEYILIPIKRIRSYNEINETNLRKIKDGEPQIIFSRDSTLTFNENIPYGFSNKVELLNIIGSDGEWKYYKDNEFLNIKSRSSNNKTYSHHTCGYFVRLPSMFENNTQKMIKQTDRSKAMLKLIKFSSK